MEKGGQKGNGTAASSTKSVSPSQHTALNDISTIYKQPNRSITPDIKFT